MRREKRKKEKIKLCIGVSYSNTCRTTDERGYKVQIDIWIIGSNESNSFIDCINSHSVIQSDKPSKYICRVFVFQIYHQAEMLLVCWSG